MSDAMSPEAKAKKRVKDIIERQNEILASARLPNGEPPNLKILSPDTVVESLFDPHGGGSDAISRYYLAISDLLNPQGDHKSATKFLTGQDPKGQSKIRMAPWTVQAVIDAGRTKYVGPGWSNSEREGYKRVTGKYPQNWELGPGDYMSYQRMLDADYLSRVRNASYSRVQAIGGGRPNAPNDWRDSELPSAGEVRGPGGMGMRPRTADNNQSQYEAALSSATLTYDRAKEDDGKFASGVTGSVYPWNQGIANFGLAMGTTDSPIARFMNKGRVLSDAAAYMGMTGRAPLTSATTFSEAYDHLNHISPDVPDGTPEERQQFLDKHRNALDASGPPTYSESYYETHGKPPSYFSQGVMNLLNNLVDASPAAVAAAPKIVGKVATGLAWTGFPLISAYGSHIVNKTMQGASTPFGRLLLGEVKEDVPFTGAMQGLNTVRDTKRPPLSKWFSPGIENRRDMKATTYSPGFEKETTKPMYEMTPEETAEYFKQQDRDRDEAQKMLEQYNMQHRNSYLSSQDWPSVAVRAVADPVAGAATAAYHEMAPSIDKAAKANAKIGVPFVPMGAFR